MALDASSEALKVKPQEGKKMATDRMTGPVPDSDAHHRRNKLLLKAAAAVSLTAAALGFAKGAGVGSSEHHDNILEVPKATQKVDTMPNVSGVEAPKVLSFYDSVRQEVGKSPSAEKADLLAFVDKFDKTDAAITSLVNLSNSQTEPDGTPTIVKLTLERAGNIDLTGLYPGTNAQSAARRYVDDNVDFLSDNRNLQSMRNAIEVAKLKGNDALLAQLKQFEQQYANAFSIDYTKVGTKLHQEGVTSVTVDKSVATDPKAASVVSSAESFLKIAPKIGDRKFVINDKYGGEAKRVTNDMEIGLNYPGSAQEMIAHEAGHTFDIVNLSNLAPYLSVEDIYKLEVAREKLIVGGFVPKMDRIFSPQKAAAVSKMASGQQLTEAEFAAYASVDIDKRLVDDLGFLDGVVGDKDLKDYTFSASRGVIYDNLNAFLTSENANIQKLSAKYPAIAEVVADMKSRPQAYEAYWQGLFPGQDVIRSQKNWWGAFEDMVKVRYLEQIYTGKVQNPDIAKQFLGTMWHYSGEYTANSLGFGILYQGKINGPSKVGDYLSVLR